MDEGLSFSDIFDDDIPYEQKPPEMLRPMEENDFPIQAKDLFAGLWEGDLLTEVHLQDLYHATDESSLLEILQTDALKLTFAGGTQADEEINKGYPFFLATMRQKYGNYARGFGGRYGDDIPGNYRVVIHIDGTALKNAGFKHFPVDFWGSSERNEQEERIVSFKDEIRPLHKFVKDIHVYLQAETKFYPRSARFVNILYKISELAPKRNIKVYFYPSGTQPYFKSHRHEKATTDITTLLQPPVFSPEDLEHEEWRKKRLEDPNRNKPHYLEAFLRIYNGDYSKTEIDKSDDERILRMLRWYHHDIYPSLKADVHNYRKDHPEIFREIAKIMKKEGVTRFHDLITLVINRVKERDEKQQDLHESEDLDFNFETGHFKYSYNDPQAFCVFIIYPTFAVWFKRKDNKATFFSDNSELNELLQRFNGGPSRAHFTIRAILQQISEASHSPIPKAEYKREETSPELMSGRLWGVQGKVIVSFWQDRDAVKLHWSKVEHLIKANGQDPKKAQYLFGGNTTEDALNSYEEVTRGINVSPKNDNETELRKQLHTNPDLKKSLLKLPPDRLQSYADRMKMSVAQLKWIANIDETTTI